ncbi:hypothetical protein MRX96_010066 [Rhipicephalus microplus]
MPQKRSRQHRGDGWRLRWTSVPAVSVSGASTMGTTAAEMRRDHVIIERENKCCLLRPPTTSRWHVISRMSACEQRTAARGECSLRSKAKERCYPLTSAFLFLYFLLPRLVAGGIKHVLAAKLNTACRACMQAHAWGEAKCIGKYQTTEEYCRPKRQEKKNKERDLEPPTADARVGQGDHGCRRRTLIAGRPVARLSHREEEKLQRGNRCGPPAQGLRGKADCTRRLMKCDFVLTASANEPSLPRFRRRKCGGSKRARRRGTLLAIYGRKRLVIVNAAGRME